MSYVDTNGYVRVKVGKDRYVGEHILVMEKYLGRKLLKNEIPHHIDESFKGRSNNDISNLKLMTKAEHQKHHGKNRRNSYFISFDSRQNRWHLYIRNGDKFRAFGYYDIKEDAIKAFYTGVRIDRHEERKNRRYRIYFYRKLNKWMLLLKLERRDRDGRRLEKSFGLYDTKEDALEAFNSGIKIDRRLRNVTC